MPPTSILGSVLHAFDLVEDKEVELRGRAYLDRFDGLLRLLDSYGAIRAVTTIIESAD